MLITEWNEFIPIAQTKVIIAIITFGLDHLEMFISVWNKFIPILHTAMFIM